MIHVFILNPEVGKPGFGKSLRNQLKLIPNFTYYIFDTRFPGEEKELTKRIVNLFEDDEIRIYCCGGSGTFRNVVDALDSIKQIEVTFIPIGMTNDFIKCFGENADKFKDVINLIDGDVVYLDYISSNYGCSVNGVSLGLDGYMIKSINKERESNVLVGVLPYLVTLLRSFIIAKNRRYIIEIDGISMKCNASEIMFGNGKVLAGMLHFAKNPELNSGVGNYAIVSEKSKIKLARIIYHGIKERMDYIYKNVFHGTCSSMKIKAENGGSFLVSFDGELVEVFDELNLWVKTKSLKFIVPKGVTLP